MNSIFALQNQVCCTRDVSFLNSFESMLINKIIWKLMLFWKKNSNILYPSFVFVSKAVFVLGENHFRKCFSGNEAVWLVLKILFSGNWNPLTQKKSLWPLKSFYTSIFPSKCFRKMRERERARAREIAISSLRSRRRWSRSPVRVRDPAPSLIAISSPQSRDAVDRDLACARSRSTARSREDRDLAINRVLAKITISPSRDRAVDRDLGLELELAIPEDLLLARALSLSLSFSGNPLKVK